MKMSDFGSAISCIGIREGVLAVTAEVIWRSEAAVKPSYGAVKMLTMLQGSRALSPSLPAEGLVGHGGRPRAAVYCSCSSERRGSTWNAVGGHFVRVSDGRGGHCLSKVVPAGHGNPIKITRSRERAPLEV